MLFCAFMGCNVIKSEHNNEGQCKCLSCHSATQYCNQGCSYLQELMDERQKEKFEYYENIKEMTMLFKNRCQRCLEQR